MTNMITDEMEELKLPYTDRSTFRGMSTKYFNRNRFRFIFSDIKHMKVEVIIFIYTFSYVLRSITTTSMIMDKVCLVHLEYSEEICRNLSGYPAMKTTVEKMVNNYHLAHSLLQLLPSAILTIFVGAWSDKYSRKIPISSALAGIIIDGLGATLCAFFMKSRVEYFFITALFTTVFGGFIGVLTVLYSYVSDITTPSKRTMKYAVMEMAIGLSIPMGSLAGGWIFKFYGYVAVFITSTCGHVLGFCWVLFILEETRGLDNKDSWMTKFRSFWSIDSLVSSFQATMKRRPNRGREQIWYLLVAMSIAVFSTSSTASTLFLFVHHQFNWENTMYSTVSAIFSIFSVIVIFIVVLLTKKFNVGDPWLGVAGSISLLLKNIGTGLSKSTGIYYLASFAGLFSSLATLAGRSRISKVASKEDLGKVFSFVTTAELILPILATAVVSQGFNASLEYFPGLIFVVMGSLIVIPIGIFIWLSRLPVANYEEMKDNLQDKGKELQ